MRSALLPHLLLVVLLAFCLCALLLQPVTAMPFVFSPPSPQFTNHVWLPLLMRQGLRGSYHVYLPAVVRSR